MKQLGQTFIETWVEVPTKLVKGEQRYKYLKTWVPVPHELIAPHHLRQLHEMVETTEDGVVEIRIEAKNPMYKTPRYYLVRASVQEIITITKE